LIFGCKTMNVTLICGNDSISVPISILNKSNTLKDAIAGLLGKKKEKKNDEIDIIVIIEMLFIHLKDLRFYFLFILFYFIFFIFIFNFIFFFCSFFKFK